MPSTILLVDDHPVFRQGLRHLLEKEKDLKVVGEAGDGQEAIGKVRALSPDIVVMDINMPNLDGIEATRQILAESPDTRVVALSVHSGKRFVRDMLQVGAAGYILKESVPEEMIQGIRTVLEGDVYLSAAISGIVVSEYRELLSEAGPEEDSPPRKRIFLTKLHRPPVSADIIPRARLIELLEQGRHRPLTLISAPAGYGKSVLASQWLEICGRPGAWLSLDENDSNLQQFLTYLIEAVQDVFPSIELQTRTFLQAGNLPPVSVLAHNLLNDVEQAEEPFILVLDDYQYIREEAIHDLLTKMLRYPSPMLHLTLLTRRDPPLPIDPMRAGGQLTEITMEHLRFTLSETKSFLERLLDVSPDENTLAVLEQKMEGWGAGLRLAALSMGRKGERDFILKDLGEGAPFVHGYLMQEVLSQVPPVFANFLIEISILDRFCAPLCDAIHLSKGQAVEHETGGQEFIEWLEKTHLFVIRLDETHYWFRYHHLFQQLLQKRLERLYSSQEIAILHTQATAWFEERDLIDEALKHALAAGNAERAAQIIERNWRPMMNLGKWHVVVGWLSKLPDQVVQENPLLLLAQTWKHYYYFDVAAISPIMDQIEKLTDDGSDLPDLSAEIAMFRSFVAYFENRGAESLQHIEYALANIPETDVEFHSQSEILYGLAGHMAGQLEQVTRQVYSWLENPSPIDLLRKSCLMWTLLFTHYMAGDLQMVSQQIPQLKEAARTGGIENFTAWGDYLDGLVRLQQGDMEAAILQLEQAGKRKYQHYTRAAADAMGALAIAYQANGQLDMASKTLESFEEFCVYLGEPFAALAQSCAAQVAFMDGRTGSALDWLRKTQPAPAAVMMSWYIQPGVNRCRIQVAEGSSSTLEEAEKTLRDLVEMNESHHNICQLIGILNLLAITCKKRGKTEEALTVVKQAVTLAHPGGFIFPFVELGAPMVSLLNMLEKKDADDFIVKILTAFEESQTRVSPAAVSPALKKPHLQPLVEPLTNRELDILELLIERLQTKEIAEKKFISPETVKSHLKNIYQKLGVSNRREAVEKAKSLGILTSS